MLSNYNFDLGEWGDCQDCIVHAPPIINKDPNYVGRVGILARLRVIDPLD